MSSMRQRVVVVVLLLALVAAGAAVVAWRLPAVAAARSRAAMLLHPYRARRMLFRYLDTVRDSPDYAQVLGIEDGDNESWGRGIAETTQMGPKDRLTLKQA
jgi:hypothetical protein